MAGCLLVVKWFRSVAGRPISGAVWLNHHGRGSVMSGGHTAKAKRLASFIENLAVALALAVAWVRPTPASAASLFLQVMTPAVTLTPSATDYVNDYVEVTGASGIELPIKTNDPVGMSILVRCSDPAPQVALNDFLVRTTTPPGAGGSAL